MDDSNARSSSGKITTSSSASSSNWRFFAITYDGTQGSNNVKFHFGDTSNDATLDVTRSYSQGAVDSDIGKLAIGNFNDATRSGNTDRMFRGLIDEIHIFDDALTLEQIRDVQAGNTPGGSGTATPPAAASGLSADPVSPTQVNLAWTDNAGDETGFLIERATDSGFTQNLTRFTVGSNVTRFADTSAQADTTYHYRVIATGQGGASTASNAASVTTAKATGSGTSITQTRTHDVENRLTQIDDGTSQTPLAHDADGNLTTDHHGRTLIYDAWNRLVEVKDGSTTLRRYGYDALRRRIAEDDTHLYHSHQWQVIEERTSTGDTAAQYVWSPEYVDAMIARDRDTNADGTLDERLYVQHDANFNVTAIVDIEGDVMERYEYDPYGMRTVLDEDWTTKTGGTAFNFHHGHQGGRYDPVTGLYHFRKRDYSAELGRWVSQDPMGYVDVMGLHEYVESRPGIYLDPRGTEGQACCPPYPGFKNAYRYKVVGIFRTVQGVDPNKERGAKDWVTASEQLKLFLELGSLAKGVARTGYKAYEASTSVTDAMGKEALKNRLEHYIKKNLTEIGNDIDEGVIQRLIETYLSARRESEGYSVWVGYTFESCVVKNGETVGRMETRGPFYASYSQQWGYPSPQTHTVFGGNPGLPQPRQPNLDKLARFAARVASGDVK